MIHVAYQHPARRFSRKETRRVLNAVLRKERSQRWDVSVVFTNDRHMRKINRTFLGHNEVTDVIAFPLHDAMKVDAEVYVNLDRAACQARDEKVPFAEEVRRLLIHGTLHVLGYRDSTKTQRHRMRKREDRYLALLRERR
ncbi:MAG: rRNA maturation RNase YbeY [Bacteroidota bacterium]